MSQNSSLRGNSGEVNKSDIKLASDIAWEEEMKSNCKCGSESRERCRCKRTKAYKKRARKIRRRWFGETWDKPIESSLGSLD